jgi:epoxide hydrolase-like predicted phosphatase
MLDAVIYDFGGVFIPSPFTAVRRMAAERGIADEVLTGIVFGSYDDDTDHPWHRAERGEVDIVAAAAAIAELANEREVEIDLFATLQALGGDGTVNDAMVDSVRRARAAGARTAMLTNNVAEGRDLWQRLLPVDELFDVVVDSSAVGMRKPNPAVFAHTLSELGVDEPGRAAFLDDYPGNVRAAETAGIIGILVEDDPTGAIERLDTLLSPPAR